MGTHGSGRLIGIIREASRRRSRKQHHFWQATLGARQGSRPANDNVAPGQAFPAHSTNAYGMCFRRACNIDLRACYRVVTRMNATLSCVGVYCSKIGGYRNDRLRAASLGLTLDLP